MAEKLGIVNLIVVGRTGVMLMEQVVLTFEDKKVSFQEAITLAVQVMSVGDVLKNKDAIKAEFKDLDDEERSIIKAAIAADLNLPNNPALERKVEKGFNIMLDIVDYVGEFKKKPAA